ncbi:MAG: DUF6095 family protein [Flavobacteriaceae bacterium]|nr:DUF6095 family protein [Flavobacteriaceae bacterium]MCY4215966.1 DUF6095 family protein [Flavobacteriaceae bacterium]MCY4253247.1 DUF6095 family protein [Flavobacteriaceae bacterium]
MTKRQIRLTLTYFILFVICGLISMVLIVNAFQNQGHRLYYPILIFGLLVFVTSIYYGFMGVDTLKVSLLGKKNKSKKPFVNN